MAAATRRSADPAPRLHPLSWPVATLYDWSLKRWEAGSLGRWRREILAEARGEILEVGAGTGANLPHYGPGVRKLVLSEPEPRMHRQLDKRLRRLRDAKILPAAVAAEPARHPAERLPYPEASFDAVVSTLVLCSVDDPAATLAEMLRVLRPGGRLHLIEHVGAAPGSRLRRWQERLDPLWRRCSANCRLVRDTRAALADAGFEGRSLREETASRGQPILVSPVLVGTARRPD